MKVHLQIILRIFLSIILILLTNSADAVDLLTFYRQAVQCDPILRKAWATRMAQGEQLPQQIANLLPSVSVAANAAWNRNFTYRSIPPAAVPLGLTTYQTSSYQITFNQSIFNLTNWFLTSRASIIDKQAQAVLIAASQDVIVRVVRAYLAVLNAQDYVTYAEDEKASNARQVDLTTKRFKLGIDIITSIYNAKASYDASVSQLIDAQNALRNSMVALRLITGQCYANVEKLKRPLPLLCPCPRTAGAWVRAAAHHNWNFIAARYEAIAALERVKSTVGNHFPTVALIGTSGPSYGQSTGEADTTLNTVGVQLNIPVFQGGLVLSQTRQAQDEYVGLRAEMQNQYQIAITDAEERYNDVVSGLGKIQSNRIAVISAKKSLASTEQAYKVGTRSIFDVLIAQRDLYRAQRELSNVTYAYLLNTILLKQASGCVTIQDVDYINSFLH